MPLLLDLLPLGHTLEEDDYVAAVCFEGSAQGQPSLAGATLAAALLLAGPVFTLPELAGSAHSQPVLAGEPAYFPALVSGYVYPLAEVGGEPLGNPYLQGSPTTVLLLGSVLGPITVSGSIVGPLLAGGVHGQPVVAGSVLARCE